VLAFSQRSFAVVNILLIGAWIGVAYILLRNYERKTARAAA
jgi:hypothetical protein